MTLLVDTNVFFEILLKQAKMERCKEFLDENLGSLGLTDFSLHSIGVILFRHGKREIFQKFAEDVIPKVKLFTLPIELYKQLPKTSENLNLNFDDSYQYQIAKHYGFTIVTMDTDFERISDLEVSCL